MTHSIELTKEQYRALLALIFLGEWVVNGANPTDDYLKLLHDTADHIYAHAHEFDADDWVEYCHECGAYHANEQMEDQLLPLVDEYDEETFWDVLSHHLAYRDIMMTVGPEQEMTKELEMKLWRRKEQYDQEFRKHGLDHVRLVFPGGKKGR
jgi:hypothetical protein